MGEEGAGTYVWVSGAWPRKRRPPRGCRVALPAPRLEGGRAGAGGALTGEAPAWCLWGAFVASAVQHLHKINGGYFRWLSPEDPAPTRGHVTVGALHQEPPHSNTGRHARPNPTSLSTRSNLTQLQIHHIQLQINLTWHHIQPHPAPNPVSLSTKLTSFSTKSQLTQL